MPFSSTTSSHTSEYYTRFFKVFVQPAFQHYGYHAFRSEDTPQNITKNLIANLATNDIVLAVLTDNNPNVWYELCVRHSLRQETIMMLEYNNKILLRDIGYRPGVVVWADRRKR
jgi:predicted DNA binding protein